MRQPSETESDEVHKNPSLSSANSSWAKVPTGKSRIKRQNLYVFHFMWSDASIANPVQSSQARNSLPLLSLNQTLTCTPLCSTAGVTGWVGVCLLTTLFLTDHLSKDTRGCSPWPSRRDVSVTLQQIMGFLTCGLFLPLMETVCEVNLSGIESDDETNRQICCRASVLLWFPLKNKTKTKPVFMFSWFSTSVVYS